jgi:hypothetical protein
MVIDKERAVHVEGDEDELNIEEEPDDPHCRETQKEQGQLHSLPLLPIPV